MAKSSAVPVRRATPLSFDSPESSNIQGASYDPASRKMVVTFKSHKPGEPDRSYVLSEVEPTRWDDFYAADSKGGFYAAHLKPFYPARKV